jgi:hypothetical protein
MAYMEISFLGLETTWLHTQDMVDSDWGTKYIHGFYWSVSTMVTILLYIPQNNIETIFAVCCIFIMNGMYGYSLNLIGNIYI